MVRLILYILILCGVLVELFKYSIFFNSVWGFSYFSLIVLFLVLNYLFIIFWKSIFCFDNKRVFCNEMLKYLFYGNILI